jgi:uncharacterized protein involved in cysteine biosynthesis
MRVLDMISILLAYFVGAPRWLVARGRSESKKNRNPGSRLLVSGRENLLIMQIVRGFVAPFRGALFVSRHGLWAYLAAPFFLNLLVAAGAAWGGGRWVGQKLGGTPGTHEAGLLASAPALQTIAVVLVTALVAGLVFIVLQPVLSAPFVDLLCERAERILRGKSPSAGVLRSTFQAIAHGLLKTALYLAALGVTVVAGAVTGVGGLLGAVLYGVFLAYDGFDYPLARRAVSFSGKWRYLLSRPGQTVGYCCGAGLLFFVPLAMLVAPSFAGVGATLLYLENHPERQEEIIR